MHGARTRLQRSLCSATNATIWRNAMRCTSLVLALTASLGGIASAQPGPPPNPPPPPNDTTTTTTTTTEQTSVAPTPTPPPPPMQSQPVVTTQEEPTSARPVGLAIGLG